MNAFRVRRADYEPDLSLDVHATEEPTAALPTPALPEDPRARAAAGYIVETIVDVLDGRASPEDLDGLVTLSVADGIAAVRDHLRDLRLTTLRVFQPHERAVETTAICRSGERVVAIAARLDNDRRSGWRCTAFALI